ncbi:BspA family leucine-rich repeat surface protein [Mycoplasma yeatsii]|uniref:BspA family leucine-rich repeat surface protein n=1 Tax=Mycoplasma yeatsii TaxID=51365 RepID=UPI0005B23E6F|nr:BspA family leucine-rich repeat surface protein [Mycoplasma yeatsii]AJM72048.1 PARCEL domain-containing protein [Mycoplasma yeatsii GM274B]
MKKLLTILSSFLLGASVATATTVFFTRKYVFSKDLNSVIKIKDNTLKVKRASTLYVKQALLDLDKEMYQTVLSNVRVVVTNNHRAIIIPSETTKDVIDNLSTLVNNEVMNKIKKITSFTKKLGIPHYRNFKIIDLDVSAAKIDLKDVLELRNFTIDKIGEKREEELANIINNRLELTSQSEKITTNNIKKENNKVTVTVPDNHPLFSGSKEITESNANSESETRIDDSTTHSKQDVSEIFSQINQPVNISNDTKDEFVRKINEELNKIASDLQLNPDEISIENNIAKIKISDENPDYQGEASIRINVLPVVKPELSSIIDQAFNSVEKVLEVDELDQTHTLSAIETLIKTKDSEFDKQQIEITRFENKEVDIKAKDNSKYTGTASFKIKIKKIGRLQDLITDETISKMNITNNFDQSISKFLNELSSQNSNLDSNKIAVSIDEESGIVTLIANEDSKYEGTVEISLTKYAILKINHIWDEKIKNTFDAIHTFADVKKAYEEELKKVLIDRIFGQIHFDKANQSSEKLKQDLESQKINGEFIVTYKDQEIKLDYGIVHDFGQRSEGEHKYRYEKIGNVDVPVECTQIGYFYEEATHTWRVKNFANTIKKVPISLPRRITSLKAAFQFNENEKIEGIQHWSTSNIVNMELLFAHTEKFNQDLNTWDVSNVKNMQDMFHEAKIFNGDISNWNTKSLENAQSMFKKTEAFNQDINTKKVRKEGEEEYTAWDTSNIKNMGNMFEEAKVFNTSISNWNTENVTRMNHVFRLASNFNQQVSHFNTSKVTNMLQMFDGAHSFTDSNISSWNTSNVKDMDSMFRNALSFRADLSKWNTASIENKVVNVGRDKKVVMRNINFARLTTTKKDNPHIIQPLWDKRADYLTAKISNFGEAKLVESTINKDSNSVFVFDKLFNWTIAHKELKSIKIDGVEQQLTNEIIDQVEINKLNFEFKTNKKYTIEIKYDYISKPVTITFKFQ